MRSWPLFHLRAGYVQLFLCTNIHRWQKVRIITASSGHDCESLCVDALLDHIFYIQCVCVCV